MFYLGSMVVAWSSKKKPTVALSSTEAEYCSATVATCEAIWLRRLLQDLRIEVRTPIPIYCDNMSSIQLAKNLVLHARTNHIEVHYHFVRERVLSGEVGLWYVHMDRQVADIFTKPLESDKLQHFTEMLGVQHLDVPHLRGRSKGKDTTETAKAKNLFNLSVREEPEEVETRRRMKLSRRRKSAHPKEAAIKKKCAVKKRSVCYAEVITSVMTMMWNRMKNSISVNRPNKPREARRRPRPGRGPMW